MNLSTATKLALVGLAASATAASSDFEVPRIVLNQLDKSRAPRQFVAFNQNARKGGLTYLDSVYLSTISELEILGETVSAELHLWTDSEMQVLDLSEGGQEIQIKTVRIKSQIDTFGTDVTCDSDGDSSDDAMCKPMLEAVGKTELITTDADGKVVNVEGDSSGMMSQVMEMQSQQDKLDAEQHLSQTTRVVGFIPTDVKVQPGDAWNETVDLEEIGVFTGNAMLLGYTTQTPTGADCAVFEVDGVLHMDLESVMVSLGMDDADLASLASRTVDADMSQYIFWDYAQHYAPYSEVNTTMTLKMNNEMTQEPMEIPVNETVILTTTIQGRSGGAAYDALDKKDEMEDERAPHGAFESRDPPPYSTKNNSNDSSKNGAAALTAFVVVCVMLAFVGLVMVMKRNATSKDSSYSPDSYEMTETPSASDHEIA